MSKYLTEFKLNHNEVPASINVETGEVKHLKKNNNIPHDSEIFMKDSLFKKDYINTWSFLRRYLTPIEYMIAHTLGDLAKINTNSLEPLNDNTTMVELMNIFHVSKNVIAPIMKKLYLLGVYGKFDIACVDKPYTKYWIFNPYLSFSGKIIKSDITLLFAHTHCAYAHSDKEYSLNTKVIKELKLKTHK